jgi:lysophospholipase L1-like esterase
MRFVFFGDSICFGQNVSPHLTWVSRISAELHKEAGKRDVTIVNSSVNGNTTRLALERIGNDLQLPRPDVVLIQFGLNDCNCWMSDEGHPRVSPAAYEANLREMGARARLFGASTILFVTNHLTQPDGPIERKQAANAKGTYRARIHGYNEVMRDVAKSSGSLLVDVEKAWLSGPEKAGRGEAMLDPDGLHLSLEGHDFYFEIVKPVCINAAQRILPSPQFAQ